MRVPGSKVSSALKLRFLLTIFVLCGCAATSAFGQGTAGAATAPPPTPTAASASELPQISEPNVPPPTLAPAPATTTAKVDSKYDVTKIGVRAIGRGLDFYSLERERMLGRELARQVESESRLVHDRELTEYINRIGQNIVRNSDARVPFVIKIIDDDEVNAFALPGGFFYVNTGLILAADNEAELAGVMAHEIAHVAARHATKNATRQELLNLASIPLIFFGGPAAYAVQQLAGLAVPMSLLKFSRDAEREADLLGVEYEYAAGYDPQEFVRFFEKLKVQEKQKHSFVARAFATHPMTADRIRRAQEEITRYLPDRQQYVVDTSEFQQIKAHLAALINTQRLDGGRGVRPTLRKRGPDDSTPNGDHGPVLRRP